jgi:hypothetical protein
MDFLASLIIFGPLFAGHGDLSDLPFTRTTHYEARTDIKDVQERWDRLNADRVRIRRGVLAAGMAEPSEWTVNYFDLNSDGSIHAMHLDTSNDFHQAGYEYVYAGGHLAKMVTWFQGVAEDSSVFTYTQDQLTGATPGPFSVQWADGRIQQIRQGASLFQRIDTFAYSAAGDSVRVQIQNVIGDPVQDSIVYRLENGRLASQAEFDSLGVFSTTTYQYGNTAIFPRRRGAYSPAPRLAGVDILGRKARLGAGPVPAFFPSPGAR